MNWQPGGLLCRSCGLSVKHTVSRNTHSEKEVRSVVALGQRRAERSRRLLSTTDTLLNAIAALAMMGESNQPVNGPGMKVADVFGGGGYWTELLSNAVGPEGSVILLNNAPYFSFGQKELKPRFENNRLPNTRVRVVETADMKFDRESLDLIVIFMSYHDIYWIDEDNGWPEINADRFLAQLHDALKPGGKLLIVDHQAAAGSGKSTTSALHRIEESFAKQDIESHGFALEKTWDGFRNASDDYSKLVFDPAVQGKTDRYTHLYSRK